MIVIHRISKNFFRQIFSLSMDLSQDYLQELFHNFVEAISARRHYLTFQTMLWGCNIWVRQKSVNNYTSAESQYIFNGVYIFMDALFKYLINHILLTTSDKFKLLANMYGGLMAKLGIPTVPHEIISGGYPSKRSMGPVYSTNK